jgi:hypothetical protein
MAARDEVDKRIAAAYSLKIKGVSKRDIVKFCMKNYDVCEKTAYNYVYAAESFQNEDAEEYRKEAFENQVVSLRHLYQKSYRDQDWKECRAILQQLSGLLGLDAPKKSEVNLITPPIQWVKTDEPT